MTPQPSRYRVTVFVLGDLGRSPRMLNHAVALAKDGAAVALLGYHETAVEKSVSQNPRIRLYKIRQLHRAAEGSPRLWFLTVTAVRAACLGLESLRMLLAATPRPDVILVQNPPSLPALLAAWIAARIRGSKFIIDWHNFGFAMLAPRLGPTHFVVRLAKSWERRLGRKADAHLCVSAAMRDVLIRDFGLAAPAVVYDKPKELLPLIPLSSRTSTAPAALAVCPTSWTADEDMNLLLDGLRLWDSQVPSATPVHLHVLITGRGPLRDAFEKRLGAISWRRVKVETAFLDPADYRELLRAAHLGFCLHRSTSGVDLPMKIIDLIGARTPICALDYGPCLTEQIQPGVTAATFRNAEELVECLDELLGGFPDDLRALEQMQRNIEALCRETWLEEWQRLAAPVFHGLVRHSKSEPRRPD